MAYKLICFNNITNGYLIIFNFLFLHKPFLLLSLSFFFMDSYIEIITISTIFFDFTKMLLAWLIAHIIQCHKVKK